MKKLTLYLSLIVFLGFMAAGCTDLEGNGPGYMETSDKPDY